MRDIIKLLQEPKKYFIGNEKDFQEAIIPNLPDIFEKVGLPNIKVIEQEKVIRIADMRFRIDIFIKHEDDTVSIIEVKCTNNKFPSQGPVEQCKAIGQMLLYGEVFKSMHNVEPRLILIDTHIHQRTLMVFNKYKFNINCIEINNDRVVFIGDGVIKLGI